MTLAYIVTEPGCMEPTTGARHHINMGLRELRGRTDVVAFLPPEPTQATGAAPMGAPRRGWRQYLKNSGAWGAARDLRNFAVRSLESWRLARKVKAAGCTLAYVRVQAWHPVSFFLKWHGIKVVLEANGIQHRSQKSQARSWMSWAYRPLERAVYRCADHVFFVGSYGQYWSLPSETWTEVENGVEPEMFTKRTEPICSDNPVRLILLARLVAHHKAHVLSAAIAQLDEDTRRHLELHLAGAGFEAIKEDLAELVAVKDHGFVPREGIRELLANMDCGLIPDCPPYGSQMKLLDYAAAGCLVVAPDVVHLTNFYADKGVLFFERGDSKSLADTLSRVASGQVAAHGMAQELQAHIQKDLTWGAIFDRKWAVMSKLMAQVGDR